MFSSIAKLVKLPSTVDSSFLKARIPNVMLLAVKYSYIGQFKFEHPELALNIPLVYSLPQLF